MARCINKITLMGNLGDDPRVETTRSGTKVANFSLATNEVYTDRQGERQERVQWHRCVAWDKTAELIEQYVRKGDRLYVEGKVEYDQSEDDKGNVRYWTNIVVRELVFINTTGDGGSSGARQPRQQQGRQAPQKRAGAAARRPAPAGQRQPNPFDTDDDDLPF